MLSQSWIDNKNPESSGRTFGSLSAITADARDVVAAVSDPLTITGNLTDVTEAKLYAGTLLDCWRFELRPGETKSHVFQVVRPDASQIAVVVGAQMIVNTVKTGTAK